MDDEGEDVIMDVGESETMICIGCLMMVKGKGQGLVPLSPSLARLYTDLTHLQITPESNWVCYTCKRLFRNFEQFREKCIHVDSYIRANSIERIKLNPELSHAGRSELPQFKNLSYSGTVQVDTTVDSKEDCFIDLPSRLIYKIEDEKSSYSFDEFPADELNYLSDSSAVIKFEPLDQAGGYDQSVFINNLQKKKHKTKKKKLKLFHNAVESMSTINKSAYTNLTENKVRLTKEEQMLEHQQRISSDKYVNAKYKCETCIIGFRFRSTLASHMEKHSEKRGPLMCTVCQQRFSTKRKLRDHFAIHSIRLICHACGARLRDRVSLTDHLAWHEGRKYQCKMCQAVYVRRTTLNNHLRLKHQSYEYKCDVCSQVFCAKERLREHELKHSSPTYDCAECGKLFYTSTHLSNHMGTHSTIKKHYCVECDIYFKSASILRNHLSNTAKHVDPSSLEYSCDQCEKRFRSKVLLSQHMNATHLMKKQFSCEICAANYASRQGLNFHRRHAHQGYQLPKTHTCNMCGKSFTAKALLTNHMRVHTGEKPYECSQCHRKFSQKSSLRTHIKLVHLKLKRVIKKKFKPPEHDSVVGDVQLGIHDKILDHFLE